MAQSAGVSEYTDSISAEDKTSPSSVLNMTDGDILVMLELWGMRNTPSLPLLPGPLWPGLVVPDKAPIYESNRTKQVC